MGVRYTIASDPRLFVVVEDCTITYEAIFAGPVVDETSGLPISSTPVLNVDVPGITLRFADGGIVVGSAYVANVFPDLATKAYNLNLTITAPGYRSLSVPISVPMATAFPLPIGPVVMRRAPVRLQGRVVKASDRTAITSAMISSKDASRLLLRDALRAHHIAGTTVNGLSLTASGATLTVAEAVVAGSNRVKLSSTAGIAAGDLLQIGNDVDAAVYQVGSVGPDAGVVTLTQQLNASAATSTAVQPLTASAPVGATTLVRSSDIGDGTLILSATLNGQAIEISDGTQTEYHWVNALSDANGYYRANGITGVKTMELLCSAPSFTTLDQPWMPDYSQRVTTLDLLLRP